MTNIAINGFFGKMGQAILLESQSSSSCIITIGIDKEELIESKSIDILQPDVMWVGGMTELLKISAMAAAYDLPVVPHGSGPYSSHFIFSQPHSPFCEYIAGSPDGKSVIKMFPYFDGEQLPEKGKIKPSYEPGFGMSIKNKDLLVEFK